MNGFTNVQIRNKETFNCEVQFEYSLLQGVKLKPMSTVCSGKSVILLLIRFQTTNKLGRVLSSSHRFSGALAGPLSPFAVVMRSSIGIDIISNSCLPHISFDPQIISK
jgi:hypothetical protein